MLRLPGSLRPLALLSCLLVAAFAIPLAGCDRPHQAFVRDDQGRALVLHGLNVACGAKGPTWHYGPPTTPDTALPWISEAAAHRIAEDWGFNVVRYLVFGSTSSRSPASTTTPISMPSRSACAGSRTPACT